MKTKYTSPEGWSQVVEHAAGASPDEIRSQARKQQTGYQYAPAATPETPPTPDLMGRIKQGIVAGVSQRTGGEVTGQELSQADPRTSSGFMAPIRSIPQIAAQSLIPGSNPEAVAQLATLPFGGSVVTGPLKRAGAAAVAGGATAALQGSEHPWKTAGTLAASQLVGEAPFAAARLPINARAARVPLAQREAKASFDRSMHTALTETEAQGYQQELRLGRSEEAARIREARAQYKDQQKHMLRSHRQAEQAQTVAHEQAVARATETYERERAQFAATGAAQIADAFKARVPAFQEFPSSEKGLLDMIYGKGPARRSAAFDEAMREIMSLGRGRSVEIPHKDAMALGIRSWDVRGPKEKGLPDMARVDASQLADKATGYWKKDHGVYRRAVAALDRAGLGNEEARAAYKAGEALTQFADKTQMLKGEKFNPEAAQAGFTRLKTIDELRRRGQGDIFEGPVAEAVRRPAPTLQAPPEPSPIPKPTMPAFRRPPAKAPPEPPGVRLPPEPPPMPEGVTVRQMPHIGFFETAIPVEAIITGMTGHHGFGMPGAIAGIGGKMLSKRPIVTKAPLSPASEAALRLAPGLAAEASREFVSP